MKAFIERNVMSIWLLVAFISIVVLGFALSSNDAAAATGGDEPVVTVCTDGLSFEKQNGDILKLNDKTKFAVDIYTSPEAVAAIMVAVIEKFNPPAEVLKKLENTVKIVAWNGDGVGADGVKLTRVIFFDKDDCQVTGLRFLPTELYNGIFPSKV